MCGALCVSVSLATAPAKPRPAAPAQRVQRTCTPQPLNPLPPLTTRALRAARGRWQRRVAAAGRHAAACTSQRGREWRGRVRKGPRGLPGARKPIKVLGITSAPQLQPLEQQAGESDTWTVVAAAMAMLASLAAAERRVAHHPRAGKDSLLPHVPTLHAKQGASPRAG